MATKKEPFIRTAYNYDVDRASIESAVVNDEPSLTKQSFKDECDINTIVRNFGLTGELPNVRAPTYGDFSGVMDYHSALNAVRDAEDKFMELPADMRARFHNDPQELLEFVSDDKNRKEAQKLGLVDPEPVEVPYEPLEVRLAVDAKEGDIVKK